MESYLVSSHFDLVTPDGYIDKIEILDAHNAIATVHIKKISPAFIGFDLDADLVLFNLKSTLAQLGLQGIKEELFLDPKHRFAQIKVRIHAITELGSHLLFALSEGAYIGKLFAADDRRKVRNPNYLKRMFGRADQFGSPLLSLGSQKKDENFILEKIEGFTVALLALKHGIITY